MILNIFDLKKSEATEYPADEGPPKPAKMSVTVSPLVCLMSFTLNRDRQPCFSSISESEYIFQK